MSIELRWLESQTYVVNGEPFVYPVTVRTLQYRTHSHDVIRRGGITETVWHEWQDVPVVSIPLTESK